MDLLPLLTSVLGKRNKMKTKKVIFCITLLLCFSILNVYAQENVNASGGDALGSGGSTAYSVGLVVYTTSTGPSGSANQGIQQPYDIAILGNKETALTISLTVFPNPITSSLILQIKEFDNEDLKYQLSDTQGKLLKTGSISSSQTQINTNPISSGTYILTVIQENKQIQSFKIIKN